MQTRTIPFRLTLRTWHFERAAVLWLAFVFAYRAGGDRSFEHLRAGALWLAAAPWLGAAARVAGFSALSIGDRIAERARVRAKLADDARVPRHEAECANRLASAVVISFVLGALLQLGAGSWDGVIWACLVAGYRPLWRRLYRWVKPLAGDEPFTTEAQRQAIGITTRLIRVRESGAAPLGAEPSDLRWYGVRCEAGEYLPPRFYGLTYLEPWRHGSSAVFHPIPLNLIIRAGRWIREGWDRLRCRPSLFDRQLARVAEDSFRRGRQIGGLLRPDLEMVALQTIAQEVARRAEIARDRSDDGDAERFERLARATNEMLEVCGFAPRFPERPDVPAAQSDDVRCTHTHRGGPRCVVQQQNHEGLAHLYKCAGPSCPGIPWPASESAHPIQCSEEKKGWARS